MVDLDLDIITQKPQTIKIFDKEIVFKNITMEEDFQNDLLLKELNTIPIINEDSIQQSMTIITQYLQNILEITPEEASKVTLPQFKKLQKYLERKELYDQGFNDKEIDLIEKKQIKTAISQR